MSILKKLFTPLPVLAYDTIKDLVTDNDTDNSNATEMVQEDELQRVQGLIEKGREQGLSELDIKISRNLASGFKGKAGTKIEGVPVDVTVDISKAHNGEYTMKVKYLPKTYTDELRDLKKLFDDGVLTEEEFTKAKQRVLLSTL